jgi:hypothetical protein
VYTNWGIVQGNQLTAAYLLVLEKSSNELEIFIHYHFPIATESILFSLFCNGILPNYLFSQKKKDTARAKENALGRIIYETPCLQNITGNISSH